MGAMLRCKFKLREVSRHEHGRRVVLTASNQTDGDNTDWSKWSPSGELSIQVTNPTAIERIDAMTIGDHFYLDLSPVPAA